MWQRITSLVILTVLSNVNQVPATVNCFEFFGFDVLIDSSLRPWLLEVNLSPALSNDCDADRLVKKPMLHDMFDLLGLPLYNTGLSVFNIWFDDEDAIKYFKLNSVGFVFAENWFSETKMWKIVKSVFQKVLQLLMLQAVGGKNIEKCLHDKLVQDRILLFDRNYEILQLAKVAPFYYSYFYVVTNFFLETYANLPKVVVDGRNFTQNSKPVTKLLFS